MRLLEVGRDRVRGGVGRGLSLLLQGMKGENEGGRELLRQLGGEGAQKVLPVGTAFGDAQRNLAS